MSPNTAAALADIKLAASSGQKMIAPVMFSHFHGRAATSAAFRIAKAQGVIEIAYTSCVGTPVYRAAGVGVAIVESVTAVRH